MATVGDDPSEGMEFPQKITFLRAAHGQAQTGPLARLLDRRTSGPLFQRAVIMFAGHAELPAPLSCMCLHHPSQAGEASSAPRKQGRQFAFVPAPVLPTEAHTRA